jgi:hypothetical protein
MPAALKQQDISAGLQALQREGFVLQDAEPAPNPEVEQLLADLARARVGFDPAYQHSDDFSYWSRQRDQAGVIAEYKARLLALGHDVDAQEAEWVRL